MNDSLIVAAYLSVFRRHRISVDELIATPAYRELFLAAAREGLGDVSERDLLMRLFNLRKRSKLPRARDEIVAPPAA